MKAQLRILLVLAILALAAGWAGLRRGNSALEKRLAASSAGPAGVER